MIPRHGSSADETPQAWYRHPIVWLIIAIPSSAVVMGVVIVTLAVNSPGSVVRDDYYQAGRTINVDLRGTRQAAELGVVATFHGSPDTGWMLEVSQGGSALAPHSAAVDVLLAHPTLGALDLEYSLRASSYGNWRGEIAPIAGRWLVTVTPRDGPWLLRGDVHLEDSADGSITVAAMPLGTRETTP